MPITDNFDRPDGPLGGNWNVLRGAFLIYSHEAGDDSALDSFAVYVGTFPDEQYAQAVFRANYMGVGVRLSTAGYFATADGSQSWIYKWNGGGSFTNLASLGPGYSSGDVMKLVVLGTGLTLLKNGSSALTASDAFIASGSPGIYGGSGAGTSRLDDFQCIDTVGGGGNPWYAYAQMRERVKRTWQKGGAIWTPSYAFGNVA